MAPLQYGLFKLGQIWMVSDEAGAKRGFPNRDHAAAALRAMIAGHRKVCRDVVVTIQEPGGRLRTLLNPPEHFHTSIGTDEAWDVLLGTRISELVLAAGYRDRIRAKIAAEREDRERVRHEATRASGPGAGT